jgi:hypothetical protein
MAFAQTIHMTASFLSTIAAGILLQESVSVNFYLFQGISVSLSGLRFIPPLFPSTVIIFKFLMRCDLFWCQCKGLVSKCYCVTLFKDLKG